MFGFVAIIMSRYLRVRFLSLSFYLIDLNNDEFH